VASEQPGPEGEASIGDLFARLMDDARTLGSAELDYWRTLARRKLREARAGLWWGAAAMALALAAAVALVVGLVLTLAPLVGPGVATLIVVLGISTVAAIMGRLAWIHVKRVFGGEK
jgi:hypothetical protein